MGAQNILIVEDELIAALDLRNQVRRFGYHVSALAKSGEEAVRLAEELSPDLVLMDVSLAGGMDGIEASCRINATRHTRFVYLTAYPQVFLKKSAQMQEPCLCMSKPFSVSDLQAVLQIALAA